LVASLEDRTLRTVVTRKKDEISVGRRQRETERAVLYQRFQLLQYLASVVHEWIMAIWNDSDSDLWKYL